jgi:hypothetical protein
MAWALLSACCSGLPHPLRLRSSGGGCETFLSSKLAAAVKGHERSGASQSALDRNPPRPTLFYAQKRTFLAWPAPSEIITPPLPIT